MQVTMRAMCVEELCGVPWKQPRFHSQSDGSRMQENVDCLLDAYSPEIICSRRS
jgi:hypothetical protein